MSSVSAPCVARCVGPLRPDNRIGLDDEGCRMTLASCCACCFGDAVEDDALCPTGASFSLSVSVSLEVCDLVHRLAM